MSLSQKKVFNMLTLPSARVASQHEQAGATATAPANEAPPATVSSRVLSALFKVMRFVRVHRPEANENPRPPQVATETVGMTSTQGSDLRSRSASAHPPAVGLFFSHLLAKGQEFYVQANLKHNQGRLVEAAEH
ncbi:MAG: hypothetical protein QM527_04575 [Alphaproteobacteria bacterium]|nr:hypothetical protein [Alphaproteobacteria bacterium]